MFFGRLAHVRSDVGARGRRRVRVAAARVRSPILYIPRMCPPEHTFINKSRIASPHETVYRNVGRVRNMKSCKTNPQLIATIDTLKAKTRETEAAIWRDTSGETSRLGSRNPRGTGPKRISANWRGTHRTGRLLSSPGKSSPQATSARRSQSPRTTSRTLPPRPSWLPAERRSHSRSWLRPTPREPASGS